MDQATIKQTSPAQTLAVLAATLALVVWLRHDAIDTYWQQTRHSELGLSALSDDLAWTSGVQFSNNLAGGLNAHQQWLDQVSGRLTLATNIVLNGPQALTPVPATAHSSLVATTSLANAPLVRPENNPAASLSLAGTSATSIKPNPADAAQNIATKTESAGDPDVRTAPPPVNTEGRIVLTPQDKVLLVGDSMMQGVAPHVARALQKANISSLDLSKQSTGLAYPSYFDWPATVQKAIPDSKITVMVVFLGANDTWDIYVGGRAERFGSEKWQSVYASRIDSMVKYAEAHNVRVIWLGAPNMGRDKINNGVKILNQLYAAENNDGMARYLSTRELLGGGDSDIYQKHITTEDGKTVTVRTDDGIHFTRTGQEMLSNLILRQFAMPAPPAPATPTTPSAPPPVATNPGKQSS